MAKYLELDKKLYGVNGMIPLKRGDAWNLNGQVVDKYASYKENIDISGFAATAYFPGATGGVVTAAVTFPNDGGAFAINVAQEDTPNVALSDGGIGFYLISADEDIGTIETPDEPLEIRDRGFTRD